MMAVDFAAIVEGSASGVIATDAEDLIVYANRAAAEQVGRSSEELIGKPASDLFARLPAPRALEGGVRVYELRSDDDELLQANIARERAEAGQRRANFLAHAASALVAATDLESALQALARVAVPQLGDWCAIDLPIGKSGRAQRVAWAHVDPSLAHLPVELQRRYPADPAAAAGFPHVLRTGQVEYWPEVPESMLRGAAVDEDHLKIMRQLGFASYMCVPISRGGRVLGAMTFVSARANRRFAPTDLATAEELARRAALALETLSRTPGDGRQAPRAPQTDR
jgi:GAF domain-containing protein